MKLIAFCRVAYKADSLVYRIRRNNIYTYLYACFQNFYVTDYAGIWHGSVWSLKISMCILEKDRSKHFGFLDHYRSKRGWNTSDTDALPNSLWWFGELILLQTYNPVNRPILRSSLSINLNYQRVILFVNSPISTRLVILKDKVD